VAREHQYRGVVRWSGAGAGPTIDYAHFSREHALEFEGKPVLAGSADPAFRGDAGLHNPEDLLLGSLSACHMLSYLSLCGREGIAVVSYRDDASATMSEEQGSGRFTSALLRPQVVLAAETSDTKFARALELHDTAREQCFIANSVNFPVEHEPLVRRSEPA
jgi:organic hydroperoxide reductase OsmC/OhrA